MADGEALGGVVAGHGELDDDAQRRPLGRRELLVLERQQAGRRVVEAAQPGLEAGDVVLRPPAAELLALPRQAVDAARPSAGRGARRSWRPGTRPAPGGRGGPSRRSARRSVRMGEQHPDQVALDAVEAGQLSAAGTAGPRRRSRRRTPSAARARTPAPARSRRSGGAARSAPRRARSRAGAPATGWASETRWSWPASSRRSARPIARSTSSEALIRRPCSSHVYQVTDTPASRATSSRRSPGVRRPRPRGSSTCSGVDRLAPDAQELGRAPPGVRSIRPSTTADRAQVVAHLAARRGSTGAGRHGWPRSVQVG